MPAPDLQTLEQLVDGELSADAYRAALRSLDQHPANWKTLAGLFLEAQALRGDLAASVATKSVARSPRENSRGPSWVSALAAAACLLVGVGLGSLLIPRLAPLQTVELIPPAAPHEQDAPPQLREVSVPVYAAGDVDPLTLWSSSAELPPGIVEQARERRQRLVREFQVVPVALADGSQVAVPVERVKLVNAPLY